MTESQKKFIAILQKMKQSTIIAALDELFQCYVESPDKDLALLIYKYAPFPITQNHIALFLKEFVFAKEHYKKILNFIEPLKLRIPEQIDYYHSFTKVCCKDLDRFKATLQALEIRSLLSPVIDLTEIAHVPLMILKDNDVQIENIELLNEIYLYWQISLEDRSLLVNIINTLKKFQDMTEKKALKELYKIITLIRSERMKKDITTYEMNSLIYQEISILRSFKEVEALYKRYGA